MVGGVDNVVRPILIHRPVRHTPWTNFSGTSTLPDPFLRRSPAYTFDITFVITGISYTLGSDPESGIFETKTGKDRWEGFPFLQGYFTRVSLGHGGRCPRP